MTCLTAFTALLTAVWMADPAAPGSGSVAVENALVRVIEQVEIPARKEGLLRAVKVREGDVVRAGDLLAVIDDEQARLSLQRAEVELQLAREKSESDVAVRAARRAKDHAQTEFERAERARQTFRGSISDAEFERLKLERDKTALELERALEEKRGLETTRHSKEVEWQLARLEVAQRQVTAPLPSMVVQIYHPPGEWVQPGQQMFRVLRIDRLRVECYVTLDVAEALVPQTPVAFVPTSAGAARLEHRGEVVFIHPESDPVNGQVRIWAEVNNTDGKLRPGMRGRLRIAPAVIQQTSGQPPAAR